MTSISGIGGFNLLPNTMAAKKSPASMPFGDLLSKQGLVLADAGASGATTSTAAGASTGGSAANSGTAKLSAAAEFQQYMNMTPAEKIRYNMLQQLGLTEDDLKAMPAPEREKIETTIANRIKEMLGANASSNDTPQNTSSPQPVDLFKSIQSNQLTKSLVDIYS